MEIVTPIAEIIQEIKEAGDKLDENIKTDKDRIRAINNKWCSKCFLNMVPPA